MSKAKELLSMLSEAVKIKLVDKQQAALKEVEKILNDKKNKFYQPKLDKEKFTVTLVNDVEAKQLKAMLKKLKINFK